MINFVCGAANSLAPSIINDVDISSQPAALLFNFNKMSLMSLILVILKLKVNFLGSVYDPILSVHDVSKYDLPVW